MSFSRSYIRRAASLLMAIALCSTLHAQTTYRRVTGMVTDPRHEPLVGAIVQLHDDNTDSVISFITDRSGRYSFKRFSAQDDYHVWATFRGKESHSKYLSKFDAKTTRTVNLIVKPQ